MRKTSKVSFDNYNKPFPSRLRELLHKKNATQAELARAIGVSQQTISPYVNGETEPTLSSLSGMADFFNVSIDYLVGRSTVKNDETQRTWEESGLSPIAIDNLFIASNNRIDSANNALSHSTHDHLHYYETGRKSKLPFLNTLLEDAELWEKLSVCAHDYITYKTLRHDVHVSNRTISMQTLSNVEKETAKETLVELLNKINWED